MGGGRGVDRRPGGARVHWFEDVADFLGPAYLRYSFTMGTDNEVGALIDLLALRPGERVLDVGCGPGRHALALGAAGLEVVGVDISPSFIELAIDRAETAGLADRVSFRVTDARSMPFEGEFDAAISLCQGAFGLCGGPVEPAGAPTAPIELDEPVLESMARSLRPGGRLAVSAFSSYFQVRYLEAADSFDAATGVNHEETSLRDVDGDERPAELWTTCFTPRELRLLARVVGLDVTGVHSVTPGRYRRAHPTIESPEFLLLAAKPPGAVDRAPDPPDGRPA